MFRIKRMGRQILLMLGVCLFLALLFGLIFGFLYGQYAKFFFIAFGVSLTIFIFNSLLFILLLPKLRNWPAKKKVLWELGGYFFSSLLGFLAAISVFSRVYRFTIFEGKVLLINLGLLVILYLMMAGLIYSFKFHRELRDKEIAAAKLKALAVEAELKALKAQLNPHFLFNTLNSINALSTHNPLLARKMITRLSNLLRMALDGREDIFVPLRQELDFVHLYLDIENVRFDYKLDYRESIEQGLLDTPFPSMILQPLMENALRHGLAGRRRVGKVRLDLKSDKNLLKGRIWNTVGRMPCGVGNSSERSSGLSNIRQRLDLLFGPAHVFQAGPTGQGTYEVNFSFPLDIGTDRGKD